MDEELKCHICGKELNDYDDRFEVCHVCGEYMCEEHIGDFCDACSDEEQEIVCFRCKKCTGEV